MTPEQKVLVQTTFQKVQPNAVQVADLFYNHLFELDPSLHRLFTGNMVEQGRKLMQTLSLAVSSLDRLNDLVPVVQRLGERHVSYGVTPDHYPIVAEALLWTLQQGLGDEFTDEVKTAWVATYTVLADVMIEAASHVQPPSSLN
jgi:hemoglobin-like flavoprotein